VSNTGPKPTNVATFSKRDRKAIGGMIWKCLTQNTQVVL
jgi:hypothetical protein